MTAPGGFKHTYGVELLCESEPSISKAELYRVFQRRCPGMEPLDGKLDSELLCFVHKDQPVHLKDGVIPAQTLIVPSEQPLNRETLEGAIQQSWGFPEAQAALARAKASVLVSDFMASSLEPYERVRLFVRVLAAVLEVIPCVAIHWHATDQLVDPRRFLENAAASEAAALTTGPINVRMYRVSNSPGDVVMDTLGLTAVGLPDLQCHFRGLYPNQVARVLHNTALYILERGDVIEDGHTVQGVTAADKWRCQHEKSLLQPAREVLDLNPGAPFAAGKR